MIPCYKLNNHKLDFRSKDSLFNYLLDLWSKQVGVDIEKQIINWDENNNYLGTNSTPYSYRKQKD